MGKVTDKTKEGDNKIYYFVRLRDLKLGSTIGRIIIVNEIDELVVELDQMDGYEIVDIKEL